MKYYYLVLELIPIGCWIYAHRCLNEKNVQYKRRHKFIPTQQMKQKLGRSLKASSTLLILLNVIFFFCHVMNYYFVTALNIVIPIVSYLSSKVKERPQKASE